MKLLTFITLIPLSLMSVSSQAAIGEVEGKTSCTIIKSLESKVAKEVPCSYKGLVESSMSHTLSHVQYNLQSGEVFETVDDATFSFGNKGAMTMLTSPTSINSLPAETINLRAKSYNSVPKSEMKERYKVDEAKFPDVLHCFKLTQHDEAFCVPYDVIGLIS